MAKRHQRRCSAGLKFLITTSLARSSLSFAPQLLPNRAVVAPQQQCLNHQGMSSDRVHVSRRRPTASSARALRAAAAPGDGGAVDSDSIDDLVGIEEFRVEKERRDREEEEAGRVAPPPPAAATGKGVDLGLGGAIFPSDAFPGSPATDDITLQGVRLEDGQPQAMVGFWQLYGSTGDGEDLSGRVILRADGQVVGGPTVKNTPDVEWSDPEGLKPVGGRWGVYSDQRTGRARLQFTIVLSFQKKQQLEMDGVVLMVGGIPGEMAGQGAVEAGGGALEMAPGDGEPQPQVFGDVRKRSGDALETGEGEGDFSMMKVPAGMDNLIATVGSQQKRVW